MNINWGIISIIIANFSLVPACIGIMKIKLIPKELKYFVYLLWIYFFVEFLGSWFLLFRVSKYNCILSNIFVLFDFIYLYIMLNFWNKKGLSKIDYFVISIIVLGWTYENLIFSSLNITNSGFRIIYPVFILIKAIEHIYKVTSITRSKLFSNSNFITASTLILFYSYKVIYESIYYFNLNLNPNENIYVYIVLLGINLISYLLYTIAVLCMRNKIQLNTSYY